MMRPLSVFKDTTKVGDLSLDTKRCFVFKYSPSYIKRPDAHPISLQLPLKSEPFENDISRPFFSNLLPEGNIKETIARIFQISKTNDMALLEKIGGECAGAISILPDGFSPENKGDYIDISDDELISMITDIKSFPLLINKKDLRLSLAGAQEKIPVYFNKNQIYLTKGTIPSSHILKPENPYFPGSVHNEAFCMKLAEKVGFPVPDVYLKRIKNTVIYIIKRYDRIINEKGKIIRLHQEDFCQALGFLPDQKYQAEGGPGLSQCFELIKKFSSQPLRDRKKLLDWIIFNFLIGNADAHAKNISILFDKKSAFLAPFYDLISTLVYPQLTSKMAMKIGKENRFRWLQKRHWERFARENDIKKQFLFLNIKDVSKKVLKKSLSLSNSFKAEYGGDKIIDDILKIIKNNYEILSSYE